MAENYIKNHPKGTTWYGMELLVEEEVFPFTDPKTYTPKDLTGISVFAEFYKKNSEEVSFTFKTDDESVSIPNPIDGKIIFQPKLMDEEEATYAFNVLLIKPNAIEGKDDDKDEILNSYWTID
jgi:hypothetical protein